MKEIMKVYL